MLSIRFTDQAEWWVSGETFDRLFQAGLKAGAIAPELEFWRHAANANGGLSLSLLEPSESNELARCLYETAKSELLRVEGKNAKPEDKAYKEGLMKLLGAL